MKILRGTGIDGLTWIKNIRKYERYSYFFLLRPLLIFKKKEIEKYLFLKKIGFRLDNSNFENNFFRNKISNIVFPKLEKLGNIKKKFNKYQKYFRRRKIVFWPIFFQKTNENIIDVCARNEKPIILNNKKFLEINKNFLLLEIYSLLKNKADFVHI